jgi:hypothetical protein
MYKLILYLLCSGLNVESMEQAPDALRAQVEDAKKTVMLLVTNLPYDLSTERIMETLAGFGVTSVRMPHLNRNGRLGMAVVEMPLEIYRREQFELERTIKEWGRTPVITNLGFSGISANGAPVKPAYDANSISLLDDSCAYRASVSWTRADSDHRPPPFPPRQPSPDFKANRPLAEGHKPPSRQSSSDFKDSSAEDYGFPSQTSSDSGAQEFDSYD